MNWWRHVDVYDAVGLVSFLALEYGVAQWSHPAAFVLAGCCGLTLCLWPLRGKVKP